MLGDVGGKARAGTGLGGVDELRDAAVLVGRDVGADRDEVRQPGAAGMRTSKRRSMVRVLPASAATAPLRPEPPRPNGPASTAS